MDMKNEQTKFELSICYGYWEIHIRKIIAKKWFFRLIMLIIH